MPAAVLRSHGFTVPWCAVPSRGEFTHGRHTWIPPHAFSSTAPKSDPKSQHIHSIHTTWYMIQCVQLWADQATRRKSNAFFKIRKFKYVTNYLNDREERSLSIKSNPDFPVSESCARGLENDSGWNGVVMRATAFQPDNASVMPV